ncbi:PspA/IM30 family protein [Thermanaerosceptrum fracticalcis]|uniref:PspA/IM30 family protein n=1 Tax=Thermanaerosceptrum fracticalcis TaxID=1712410 RepID=A0A7G6E6V3_THEFR|nr:PspA/IM30 family protein [Thermanaerosceptrum fracticalcis]QNB47807.1 PspA/IM30 family protein [Thermanaerosceptrum fracticalcis]
MGIVSRLKNVFGAKLEKGLNALENPKEMLDYSLVKMEEGLHALTRNATELGTAKKRLELQRETLKATIRKYEEQAQKALEFGQEDLAKEALTRKLETEQRITGLDAQIADMNGHLQKIAKSQEELRYKIQNFRSRKEELKAIYAASQAQLKVKELVSSVGLEAESIGRTVERAEARIQEMQAKGKAIDELVDQGLITEVFADTQDDIDRKLKKLNANSAVEAELERLKKGLAG